MGGWDAILELESKTVPTYVWLGGCKYADRWQGERQIGRVKPKRQQADIQADNRPAGGQKADMR